MHYLINQYADQMRRGIALCLKKQLLLPALALLYSSIDIFGFLVSAKQYATKQTFVEWVEQYMAPFLKKKGITGLDLYSARCGMLHTGQAASRLVDSDNARELWYRFRDFTQANTMTNTSKPPVLIDVDELVEAFNAGLEKLIVELGRTPDLLARANAKAERFFRKGLLIGPL